ncbi:MAG: DNA polymerase IV [Syntrophobacteraceae bacterium]
MTPERQIYRHILHVDMDAFYASVEQLDDPDLRGKPVIVGVGARGVVSAASYEARRFGVRSAMPIFQAKKLCPRGIFVPVRMERYKEASRVVMDVLREFSPVVEQVSIDEAFVELIVAGPPPEEPAATAMAIRRRIREATCLTCSIGAAPNKFLAKIASDVNKPDGLAVILEEDKAEFLWRLPVGKIPGVGKKAVRSLQELGVATAGDVLRMPPAFWSKRFGKFGAVLYDRARGIDDSPVEPYSEPKSFSAEDTFAKDTEDAAEIERWLLIQAESVGRDLRRRGWMGRTVTVKVKLSDFTQHTRSKTLADPTDCTHTIFREAVKLFREMGPMGKSRLVGVGVSNLSKGEARQLKLFSDPAQSAQEKLDRAMDDIRARFGPGALRRGRLFEGGD